MKIDCTAIHKLDQQGALPVKSPSSRTSKRMKSHVYLPNRLFPSMCCSTKLYVASILKSRAGFGARFYKMQMQGKRAIGSAPRGPLRDPLYSILQVTRIPSHNNYSKNCTGVPALHPESSPMGPRTRRSGITKAAMHG